MPSDRWRPLTSSMVTNSLFSAPPAVAKYARSPGANSSSRGQGGHVDQFLGGHDGNLVEGGDPAGESVDEVLDLRIRDDAVHVAVFGGKVTRQ